MCVEARVRPLLTRSLSLLPVRLHAPMDAPRAPPTDAPVMTRLAHRVSTIFLEKCVCVVFFLAMRTGQGLPGARARAAVGGGGGHGRCGGMASPRRQPGTQDLACVCACACGGRKRAVEGKEKERKKKCRRWPKKKHYSFISAPPAARATGPGRRLPHHARKAAQPPRPPGVMPSKTKSKVCACGERGEAGAHARRPPSACAASHPPPPALSLPSQPLLDALTAEAEELQKLAADMRARIRNLEVRGERRREREREGRERGGTPACPDPAARSPVPPPPPHHRALFPLSVSLFDSSRRPSSSRSWTACSRRRAGKGRWRRALKAGGRGGGSDGEERREGESFTSALSYRGQSGRGGASPSPLPRVSFLDG